MARKIVMFPECHICGEGVEHRTDIEEGSPDQEEQVNAEIGRAVELLTEHINEQHRDRWWDWG